MLCNALIAGWTAVAVWQSARRNKRDTGSAAATFRYFTTDSNLLSGMAALTVAVCQAWLLCAGNGGAALPQWAVLLKYVGTVAVAVTFLTVVVFCGPAASYREMFADEGLFLHLIGPLLAALSFGLLDGGAAVGWGQTLLGVLPTLVYGALYFGMVIVRGEKNGGWEDFYGFNKGGKWAVSVAAMLAGTYVLCVLLMLLHNMAV